SLAGKGDGGLGGSPAYPPGSARSQTSKRRAEGGVPARRFFSGRLVSDEAPCSASPGGFVIRVKSGWETFAGDAAVSFAVSGAPQKSWLASVELATWFWPHRSSAQPRSWAKSGVASS